MLSVNSTTSSFNPFQTSQPGDNTPTERDKDQAFKTNLRKDAIQISKVELEGSKNLALIESAAGNKIDIRV